MSVGLEVGLADVPDAELDVHDGLEDGVGNHAPAGRYDAVRSEEEIAAEKNGSINMSVLRLFLRCDLFFWGRGGY